MLFKKRKTVLIGVLILAYVLLLIWLASPIVRLHVSGMWFSGMIKTRPAEALSLTIYFMDWAVLTRAPLSINDLKELCHDDLSSVLEPTTCIVHVSYDDLKNHWKTIQKLELSRLQLPENERYLNARLYYVFEMWDSQKILEVAISEIGENAYVNGVEVEYDPVLIEIIAPFIDLNQWEEDRS